MIEININLLILILFFFIFYNHTFSIIDPLDVYISSIKLWYTSFACYLLSFIVGVNTTPISNSLSTILKLSLIYSRPLNPFSIAILYKSSFINYLTLDNWIISVKQFRSVFEVYLYSSHYLTVVISGTITVTICDL